MSEYHEINLWIRDNIPIAQDDHCYNDRSVFSLKPYVVADGEIRFNSLELATMFAMRFGAEDGG